MFGNFLSENVSHHVKIKEISIFVEKIISNKIILFFTHVCYPFFILNIFIETNKYIKCVFNKPLLFLEIKSLHPSISIFTTYSVNLI